MPDRLLTTKDIQDLLRLDRVTIYKLVKDGELPALRVGGQWRFVEGDVRAWLQRQHESGGVADAPGRETDEAVVSLKDLIPLETLQSIQNQFAHLLGVASFTIDREGKPFVACSRCSPFCQLVHSTPAGWEACRATWRAMAGSAKEGSHIYRCHAGLEYASAPVLVNGERLAMVTAGQFLTDDMNPERFAASAQATGERIGVDGRALAVAGKSLEVLHADRALQVTGLLATIANALSSIGYQSFVLRQKLAKIAAISGGEPAQK